VILISLRTFKHILIILFILAVCFTMSCYAEVNESQAVRAIIGEASGEGYQGMLAVACGIRNRSTLKGVYGLKAKHVDNEPQWVWKLAKKAYRASLTGKDITNGGTHWENTKAFGEPYWAKHMVVTARIGSHTFYKEK